MSASSASDRPWRDLSESGLLWLINSSCFHVRGFALSLVTDEQGQITGWDVEGDGTEAWVFDEDVAVERKYRADAFLDALRPQDVDKDVDND